MEFTIWIGECKFDAVFERFTDRARRVVVMANEESRNMNHSYIGTEHVLLGLLREEEGIGAQALMARGADLDRLRERVAEIVGQGTGVPTGHIPFTPRAKRVLELSLRESLGLGHDYIGTEHILLGLLREGEGVAFQALRAEGIDLEQTRLAVMEMAGADPEKIAAPRRVSPSAQSRCPHPDEQLIVTRLESGIRTVRCKRCGRLIAVMPEA